MTEKNIPIGSDEEEQDTTRPLDEELEAIPEYGAFVEESNRKPRTQPPRPWVGVKQETKTVGGKEQKALIQKMLKLNPWKYEQGQKQIKLTPLTQMYLVRYLGPYLYEYTDAAIEKRKIETKKKASNRTQIENRMKSIIRQAQLDAKGEMTNKPLALDSDLDLDVIFPFNRLKTLLKRNDDDRIIDYSFGLLQQYYSALVKQEKSKWATNFFTHMKTYGREQKEGTMVRSHDDYIDAMIAFTIENTATSGGKSKQIKFLDDPAGDKPVKVAKGGTLLAFGLNIILSEISGHHKLAEAVLKDLDIDFDRISEFVGVAYLLELMLEIYNQDDMNDVEEGRSRLHDMISNQYSVLISTLEKESSVVVMYEDLEVRSIIQMIQSSKSDGDKRACLQAPKQTKNNLNLEKNPLPGLILMEPLLDLMMLLCNESVVEYETTEKPVKQEFTEEEVIERVNGLKFMMDLAVEDDSITSIDLNGNYLSASNMAFDNGMNGFCVLADEEGMNVSAPDESQIESFNAMGQVIEQIMLDNAIKASMGSPKKQAATRYDETINGLIGDSTYIGIATYHAAVHFQYLMAQLKQPFKNWNVESQEVVGGRLLAIEAYFDDPSKLLLYWMLNFRDYLDWGATDANGNPRFFKAPLDQQTKQEINAFEKNKIAQVILSYYRLSFAMLATKEVFTGKKKPKGSADIKEYWKKLINDANNDPPSSNKFVQMLAYSFGNLKARNTRKDVVHPTWMPPPADIDANPTKQESSALVTKYLKWAYGQRPIDISWFGEVAAVYHAAKAISIDDNYSKIVTTFIDAVAQDGGHPFLFAILLNPKSSRDDIPQTPATRIVIEDIEKVGGRERIDARFGDKTTKTPDDDDKGEGDGGKGVDDSTGTPPSGDSDDSDDSEDSEEEGAKDSAELFGAGADAARPQITEEMKEGATVILDQLKEATLEDLQSMAGSITGLESYQPLFSDKETVKTLMEQIADAEITPDGDMFAGDDLFD